MKYFKVETKYLKAEENSDSMKEITEYYLFKAVNYTDAEAQAHKKMEEIVPENSSFKISKIEPMKVSFIIDQDHGHGFYLGKASYTLPPKGKSKKETKVSETALINATNILHATQKLADFYRGQSNLVLTTISSVQESNILEVFEPSEDNWTQQVDSVLDELGAIAGVKDDETVKDYLNLYSDKAEERAAEEPRTLESEESMF